MIETIRLEHLLPLVFRGMEDTEAIRRSQVWEADSLLFERGCRICVQAESGGGKSSLLSFIYGNRSDYKGEIFFDKENIRSFDIPRWCALRSRSLALLPQEMRLFPELTVEENIALKNRITNHKTQTEIDDLLEQLGIAEKKRQLVGKLSIGQQQRVAVVRTICQPFDFLFLDEPVSHLDETNNRIVARIVADEAARQGAGVVATSVGNHLLLPSATFINL